jgi:small-conductance mechanosensitive channel
VTEHPLPGDDVVRAAADELLTQHRAGGAYPSVSSLAKRFHVNRTTFYRHYSAITNVMLDTAAHQNANATKRRRPRREEDDGNHTIQRLRTENTDLRRHLDIYEERIRMLTIDNQQLRQQLEQASGLTDINDRRTR